ncbi:MAG: hypothetical protein CMJ88_05715 [Planctomycetes bacterium]|nr:hypothetical protein [Planctomycetota bacterium]
MASAVNARASSAARSRKRPPKECVVAVIKAAAVCVHQALRRDVHSAALASKGSANASRRRVVAGDLARDAAPYAASYVNGSRRCADAVASCVSGSAIA